MKLAIHQLNKQDKIWDNSLYISLMDLPQNFMNNHIQQVQQEINKTSQLQALNQSNNQELYHTLQVMVRLTFLVNKVHISIQTMENNTPILH